MNAALFPNHHAGGMQHPGMAHGQQMAPGQVHHPQAMGQQMMHPGVSTPGVQHVSQGGPMMSMQPGMVQNPNQHAMSHLGGGQMVQQPNIQYMNQMNQQQLLQRQRMIAQQQQAQHQAQQQQQMAGIPMGFQLPPGMTQQQFIHHAQAQQAQQAQQNGGQMNPGPQYSMQQVQQMQQQQQQRQMLQAQQQSYAAAAQAQQHAAQQQAQQQHHLAMQQVNSQGSNHPTPGNMTGQQPPVTTGPMRPSTAMSIARDNQPSPAPSIKQQPTPVPQPTSSAPPMQTVTSQPTQNPPHTTSGPTAQQLKTAQVQAQAQQQAQQQQQQNQQQMQQQAQQQQPQAQQIQNRVMSGNAQQLAVNQQQQMRHRIASQALFKLFKFADLLNSCRQDDEINTQSMDFWSQFRDNYFVENGEIHITLRQTVENKTKVFKILNSLIPRFFWQQFGSFLDSLQLILEGTTETPSLVNDHRTTVETKHAKMVFSYRDGYQTVLSGVVSTSFIGDKMEYFSFVTNEYEQLLSRSKIEQLAAQASPNPRSPKLTKNAGPKKTAKQPPTPAMVVDIKNLPEMADWGISTVHREFFELYENFYYMSDLIYHASEQRDVPITQVIGNILQNWEEQARSLEQSNPLTQQQLMQQMQLQQQQLQQQQRPMGHQMGLSGPMATNAAGGGFMMSPHLNANMIANGSPHLGVNHLGMGNSPAQSHMAQGNSSDHSTNTSPNMQGKRRRSTAAGVKAEDGSDVNGAKKVKPSPQPKNRKQG